MVWIYHFYCKQNCCTLWLAMKKKMLQIQTFLYFPRMASFPLQLNLIITLCKNVLLWRWNILDPLSCVSSKNLSLFWNLSASRFFELWPLPSDSFFSYFTFLGCFCFWMVEFLDFSPFKFTLSKLCKTYHLILQTSYTEKYSLHLWLWTPHVLQIPTIHSRTKISLCLFNEKFS